jgi:hypothetical protein
MKVKHSTKVLVRAGTKALRASLVAMMFGSVLSSCALNEGWRERQAELSRARLAAAAEASTPPLFDWRGDLIAGPPMVNIVLNEQKAYIYRGGQEAGWTYLASGTSAYSTPTGTFRVLEKQEKKSSNRYGVIVNAAGNVVDSDAKAGREAIPRGGRFVGAPMPYWMRLTSYGIGMHAGPIPQPGLPASHGCIRLPAEMAAKLFEIVEVGTPVVITGHAPGPQDRLASADSGTARVIGAQ